MKVRSVHTLTTPEQEEEEANSAAWTAFYPTGGSVWRRDFRRRTVQSATCVAATVGVPTAPSY